MTTVKPNGLKDLNVEIRLAESDADVEAAFNVMRHLRKLSDAAELLEKVRRQQQDGYLLVVLGVDGEAVAAAGFRIGEKLAWGRHLYVDDLVTSPECRSKGYGGSLVRWLYEYAQSHGCESVHLDSRTERVDAHRFYEREGFDGVSFHLVHKLHAE